MAHTQYAVALDPPNWDEFRYHERQVNRLRRFLAENNHPYAMVFSGYTGTGKTTAARLFIKALFCENRQPGESNACGQCRSCKQDPRVTDISQNVLWIQKGQNEETIGAQFKRAFEEITRPPYGMDEEHRHYKVIVFDELQTISKDKLQELLFYPEVPALAERNKVILIFITMNEDGIRDEVLKPLRDRSRYFKFSKLTDDQVKEFLAEKFRGAPEESLEIISHWADGSIRSALTAMQDCLEEDPSLNPITTAEVLYYVSQKTRLRIWHMLRTYSYKALSEFWKANSHKFDENKLVHQMMRDLDEAMVIRPTTDQLQAHRALYHWLSNPAKIRALDALKLLIGLDLVDTSSLPVISLEQSGYERLTSALEPK